MHDFVVWLALDPSAMIYHSMCALLGVAAALLLANFLLGDDEDDDEC